MSLTSIPRVAMRWTPAGNGRRGRPKEMWRKSTMRQRGLFCVVPELTGPPPLLHKLHWLPVARRIQYKILLLSYRITHRHAQFYLRDLLPSYQPTRCLRSSSSNALVVPRTRGKAGDAAFSVAAPRLWNALPHQLKCIANINISKNNLKTHLFTC